MICLNGTSATENCSEHGAYNSLDIGIQLYFTPDDDPTDVKKQIFSAVRMLVNAHNEMLKDESQPKMKKATLNAIHRR